MSALQVPASGRAWLLDLFKGVGCLLIVLHHLAFYGPMADVVALTWPRLIGWLDEHGRLAVQVFLVCGGYLTANSLAKQGTLSGSKSLVWGVKRYLRLAMPLLAALSLTVLVSELLRPYFNHDALSPPPTFAQTAAHVFFLQHVWGMDGLSAGVWYAAIDLQLYLSALLVLWVSTKAQSWRPQLSPRTLQGVVWLVLVTASLWWWNRHAELEDLNLYFLGAYGLGWLAYSVRQVHQRFTGALVLMLLGTVAWWLEPRWQVATACGVAMVLVGAPTVWLDGSVQGSGPIRQAMAWLSRVSYSIFVVHFAVSLVVNAAVSRWWPEDGIANAWGMLAALALSVLAGAWLYERVEKPAATGRRWLMGALLFLASALLARALNGLL